MPGHKVICIIPKNRYPTLWAHMGKREGGKVIKLAHSENTLYRRHTPWVHIKGCNIGDSLHTCVPTHALWVGYVYGVYLDFKVDWVNLNHELWVPYNRVLQL